MVHNILSISTILDDEKYLSFLLIVGANKRRVFTSVIDKAKYFVGVPTHPAKLRSRPSGRLDVRLAYFVARRSVNIPVVNRYARDNVWVLVWFAIIPPKVKVFWWKLLHSFLPVASILRNRDILLEDRCPVFGISSEMIYHVLVLCLFATSVWGQFTVTPQLNGASNLSWVE
ncbi:hypothetical protein PTKIN_Ptkin13bG0036100 [Pterospermum kingtungense]